MRKRIYIGVSIVILTVLIGFLTNVTSNMLPTQLLKPYLWLVWLLLCISLVAGAGLFIWQTHLESSSPPSREPSGTIAPSSVSGMLEPPYPYVAHAYTLMQTSKIIGRTEELKRISDWVSDKRSPDYNEHIFLIIAMGGMGKSALAWHWFNHNAPEKMKPLAGRIWWNLYINSDFEIFLRKALTYVSKGRKEEINTLSRSECEEKLLNILRTEPYLLVLDGLERIMDVYPHIDAEDLSSSGSEQTTADQPIGSKALKNASMQKALRQIADPRIELFLQQLAQLTKTRTLISSRLIPSALQTDTDKLIPGCTGMFLDGLDDDAALELWKALGVTGSPLMLLDTFRAFNNYPLLIKVLAGLVARDRQTPGDFDKWRENNPHFDVTKLPLATVKQHVLSAAIEALDSKTQSILRTIAAASTPVVYDTLAALLVGNNKLCADKDELESKLTELEDRGLMGWDKKGNRYELHPIVRSMALGISDKATKSMIYETLYAYFASVPGRELSQVQDWNDLIPDIEMYSALIGLGRYDEALDIFRMRLESVLIDRLSDTSRVIGLLRMLFPDSNETRLPLLSKPSDQAYTLYTLASAYQFSEQPERAEPLHRRAMELFQVLKISDKLDRTKVLLADALHAIGKLYDSESIARSFDPSTQEYSRAWLWMQFLLMTRGEKSQFEMSLMRRLASRPWRADQPSANNIALGMYRMNEYNLAFLLATRAEEQARNSGITRDLIRAIRLRGAIYLYRNNLLDAERCLMYAQEHAKKVNYAEGELPALIGLAELARKRGDFKQAREYLKRVRRPAQSGPYPLIQADARNTLAQIERDEGHRDAAIEAALEAYTLAWCTGPPFIYRQALDNAITHIRTMNAKPPQLSQSSYLPMPDISLPVPDDLI